MMMRMMRINKMLMLKNKLKTMQKDERMQTEVKSGK